MAAAICPLPKAWLPASLSCSEFIDAAWLGVREGPPRKRGAEPSSE
jgi:hypothetical protein